MSARQIVLSKNDVSAQAQYDFVMTAGGAVLAACSPDSSFENWCSVLPSVCFEETVTKNSKFVFVIDSLAALLDADEQAALLAHEHGHEILGHLDRSDEAGVRMDLNMEFEADAYAASATSATAVLGMMKKVKQFVLTILIPYIAADAEIPDFLITSMIDAFDTAMAPRIERMRVFA